jgi:hypothetical protein
MRTALLTLALAGTAFAGDIKNSDNHEYRVIVKAKDKDAKNLPINNATYYEHNQCEAYPCLLENKDSGDKATLTTKDEHVEIKSGKFVVKL